ncbi:glycerol-3-phosphate-acyltransferase [Pterulicium gracile]|uniref:Glycerol-3-phosphate-acyltransferase n=1 Tax=Pterulicium gracile TaxID=1884261 RepID=A0A5C3QRH1_9AGAR|nr:glycerol-3-phosphate-acyltransferase [Pterula gracilis]
MGELKVLHRVIRKLANWAVLSFFTEMHVIGSENVPMDGPVIITATHHNMMLDPAVLSSAVPHRILNYWSKAALFANPIMKYILDSTGNIPVDRKSKDRQGLFKGTFEALSHGFVVALFPEGTSYTEPRIMQIKDGAAWAALEYTKWKESHPGAHPKDVVVVPASMVYTNKSKYRSICRFGTPISMEDYKAQFEQDGRAAAKRMTRVIESSLTEMSLNAPNWDVMYTARMARDLLWSENRSIDLNEFIPISQTLVDVFTNPDPTPNATNVRRRLLIYYSLLQSTGLTNSVLASLPLPRDLHPGHQATLPGRTRTVLILIRDSISSLARLPFFFLPLVLHMPIYVMGRMGARLVEDEEETQASAKVLFSLLLLVLIYPATFFFLWAFLWYTPMGAVIAGSIVYLFAMYHIKMINGTLSRLAKRLLATWRVLLGIWAPKSFEMSLPALSQYTTPSIPKDNPYVDRSLPKSPIVPAVASAESIVIKEPAPSTSEPSKDQKPKRKPSSRRIIKHVLRARAEAIRALGSFFDHLERSGNTKLASSIYLARQHGWVEEVPQLMLQQSSTQVTDVTTPTHLGYRSAKEVIAFLKARGARIPTSGDASEMEWAALSTSEGYETPRFDKDEMVFVPSGPSM